MIQLSLTDEESQVLQSTLESDLSDLSYEIANTDRMDFRNQLKEKRDRLLKILDDLRKAAA